MNIGWNIRSHYKYILKYHLFDWINSLLCVNSGDVQCTEVTHSINEITEVILDRNKYRQDRYCLEGLLCFFEI